MTVLRERINRGKATWGGFEEDAELSRESREESILEVNTT